MTDTSTKYAKEYVQHADAGTAVPSIAKQLPPPAEGFRRISVRKVKGL